MFEIKPILSALLQHKSRTMLIILQIAITFSVVVNAISIINQRMTLMDRKSGLAENELFSINISAFGKDYNFEENIRADIELIRSTGGVIDAVAINQIPLSGSGDSTSIATSKENSMNQLHFNAGMFRSDSHALNTLGIKLLIGKNFTQEDVQYSTSPAVPTSALITLALAKKMFAEQTPLGKSLFWLDTEVTIVGVIEEMSGAWVHSKMFDDNLILPVVEMSGFTRMLIRVEENSIEAVMGSIEGQLLDRYPDRVINGIRSMSEHRANSYSGDEAMIKILWVVIVLLVTITALGIVGIVSFNVNQRIKQIGTRRALGARKIDIHRYFIIENMLITSFGLFVGTLLTIGFNVYLVKSFNLQPVGMGYIVIGIIVMFAIGLIAVWMPAHKASKISPAIATQSI